MTVDELIDKLLKLKVGNPRAWDMPVYHYDDESGDLDIMSIGIEAGRACWAKYCPRTAVQGRHRHSFVRIS